MSTKFHIYPVVIVACLLGLVGLLLARFQVSVTLEPETQPLTDEIPPAPRRANLPQASPLVLQDLPSNSESNGSALRQGTLRMSNQTDLPVRVALLARQEKSKQPAYGKPAHWDFAPSEGSRSGLLLSLPSGNLQLEKGDILVAFAQDGSRRYWGPYVVGETPIPSWNRAAAEWQLILK